MSVSLSSGLVAVSASPTLLSNPTIVMSSHCSLVTTKNLFFIGAALVVTAQSLV